MKEETRTIGYLCPACHKRVVQQRSVFALSASGAVVSCECGKSSLEIEAEESKFRLSVPCGVCGAEHLAECSAEKLLHGRGIGLACPETKQLCCFIGEDYAVESALEQLSLAAAKEREQGSDPSAFADSVIMYEVLSELKEIAARPDGITCACGSRDYAMEIRSTYVDLSCKQCGAKLRIPAATDEDLDRLCCRMKLQIKGE